MSNVFFAPVFFAKKMSVLTNQMAEYVEKYSVSVAPDVSESYINALYLPSEAYAFAAMILEREYETLASVPEIAAQIAVDFPKFAGDPLKTAEALIDWWATHVDNIPEYASQAAAFAEQQFINFPVNASQIWKITKQGLNCYADIMTDWIDVMVGTDWAAVPGNVLDSALNFWTWIGSLPSPFDPPILVPVKRTPSDEKLPGMDDDGTPKDIDPNDYGSFGGFNGGCFGGLGGIAPPSAPSQWEGMVCFAMAFKFEWHNSYYLENGSLVEVGQGETTSMFTIGGEGFSGMSGGLTGRGVAGGALVPPISPVLLNNPWLAECIREDFIGYNYTGDWNLTGGTIFEDGGKGFYMTYYPGGGLYEGWQKTPIDYDEYVRIDNVWRKFTVSSFWTRIYRRSAGNFFGLSPFDWTIPLPPLFPGVPFPPPGLPVTPPILPTCLTVGAAVGGLTIANMTNALSRLLARREETQ